MEAWTPKKLEQAWRIFDKAVGVIAEGIHVPTDELRAYLLEGAIPPMERDRQQSDKLSKRIYDCHLAHPNWNARQVAMYLDASYDTVRGLGSREGIVWPKASIDAALLNAGAHDRFVLQDELGHYLHMSCERVTTDKSYRWVGTAKQLLVARERYATAAPLRAVKLQQ
jgi:GNAT superfamily N-acetyltransferase